MVNSFLSRQKQVHWLGLCMTHVEFLVFWQEGLWGSNLKNITNAPLRSRSTGYGKGETLPRTSASGKQIRLTTPHPTCQLPTVRRLVGLQPKKAGLCPVRETRLL